MDQKNSFNFQTIIPMHDLQVFSKNTTKPIKKQFLSRKMFRQFCYHEILSIESRKLLQFFYVVTDHMGEEGVYIVLKPNTI